MTTTATWFAAAAPVTRRVRAFFAPVDRATQTPAALDLSAAFNLDSPPAPWMSLGFVQNLTRKAASRMTPLMTGAPAAAMTQVRESAEAHVSLEFLSWTKLTMALATGSQHINQLAGDAAQVQSGSTATFLAMNAADASQFCAGQIVAVDADYTGQTGFVGMPVAGAYVRQPLSDADYARRVTFNVGLIARAEDAGLTLADPLVGGVPAANAKVQAAAGFVDREGGTFCHEWSALFVLEGTQGERISFYYPRLQPLTGAEEHTELLSAKGRLARIALKGQWLALPVTDELDGERVVCYRGFIPGPGGKV